MQPLACLKRGLALSAFSLPVILSALSGFATDARAAGTSQLAPPIKINLDNASEVKLPMFRV